MIRSSALTKSARNQECTLNIVGVCNGNPETTVLAHLPDGTGGMGLKSNDISACFACSSCHDAIDGRTPFFQQDDNRDTYEWYLRRAMNRTLVKWVETGLVTIKGYSRRAA